MARTRRQLSDLRDEVGRLLRESIGSTGYWSKSDFEDALNRALDLRLMQLGLQQEGYLLSTDTQNIVSGTRDYTIPEGTERVRQVIIAKSVGGNTRRYRLSRDEKFYTPDLEVDSALIGIFGAIPTYRFLANAIRLSPTPNETITNGLELEIETLPSRLTADADKLPLEAPITLETLIVYDAWDELCGQEDAQGNLDEATRGRLQRRHDRYAQWWDQYVMQRTQSPVSGPSLNYGD